MKYWGALLLLPLGLLFTPVANADINDDLMFVKDVNQAGIPYGDSRENLINMGHQLCNALHSGNISYDEAVGVMQKRGVGLATGNLVASMAVEHICPDQWHQVVTSQIAFPREARILI